MLENLRMPRISTSSLVLAWNEQCATYFEVLFAFTNANLHDDNVIVFTYVATLVASTSIHNWAHSKDFYIVEDRFGMNDLDL